MVMHECVTLLIKRHCHTSVLEPIHSVWTLGNVNNLSCLMTVLEDV